jgi:hypothetical protein
VDTVETADTTIIPKYSYTYREEPKFDGFLVFFGIAIMLMSLYFLNRWRKIHLLKKKCTEKVTAVVTGISSANNDGGLRFRYKHYNASYRYEFNGTEYSGNNRIYGRQSSFKRLREGDSVTIHIDPEAPAALFDDLAGSAMRSFLLTGGMLVFTGLFLIFGKFIIH